MKFGESFLDIDQSIDIIIQSKGFLIRLPYRYIADIFNSEVPCRKKPKMKLADAKFYTK